MSNSIVDQITLDCLLNKEVMGLHVMKQRERQLKKDDIQFYKRRILQLFEDLIYDKPCPPDVTYAYHNFVNTAIHSFKIEDNNDLLQREYADLEITNIESVSNNDENTLTPRPLLEDELLMRKTVKMELPTLDKYVKRTTHKKLPKIDILLPKVRVADLSDPMLKNKGVKKNICLLYENETSNEIEANEETEYAENQEKVVYPEE